MSLNVRARRLFKVDLAYMSGTEPFPQTPDFNLCMHISEHLLTVFLPEALALFRPERFLPVAKVTLCLAQIPIKSRRALKMCFPFLQEYSYIKLNLDEEGEIHSRSSRTQF